MALWIVAQDGTRINLDHVGLYYVTGDNDGWSLVVEGAGGEFACRVVQFNTREKAEAAMARLDALMGDAVVEWKEWIKDPSSSQGTDGRRHETR